ncbi:SDR family oxidoreductase [Antiquaquibacter oligotrophicus]|nr:SDR family NAD(P)-dependent oxidoreductase [Antiquaquibacter oligotrophicus]UDF14174.1 SDR family oxidoreductase [Antiquaquibacter oligotrophicus]
MDLQLSGRVVLVVGGTGYIGSAIARRARSEGATVIVASRHPEEEEGIALDASDEASVDAALAGILETHGRLDAVVITAAPPAHELDPARLSDPEQIASAVEGKALTFLRVANAALPYMVEQGFGRIVGISGQNAFLTGNITATVRNAALNIAAKSLADEVAGSGVAINVINPGLVTDAPSPDVERARPGQSSPAQIGDLTAFLLSPLANISGESISIGHHLRGVVLP